jgi:hypothetical protein
MKNTSSSKKACENDDTQNDVSFWFKVRLSWGFARGMIGTSEDVGLRTEREK